MEDITEDRVKVLIRDEMNGRVVYANTCKIKHKNAEENMEYVRDSIKTVDRKLWAVILLLIAVAIKTFI